MRLMLIFIFGICVLAPLNVFSQREAVQIVVDVANGNVVKFYGRQAAKTYKIGFRVLVTDGVYRSLYSKFETGVLDLDEDNLRNSPRYSGFSKGALFDNELAFQWRMIKYLEDKGLGSNSTLKNHKEMLFATHEAVDRGNKDEQFFNNLRGMRLALVRLRSRLR